MNKKPIFCFVGPSASGKTTILNALKDVEEKYKDFDVIISHTTREIRDGEMDGVDYHYVSEEEFDKLNKIEEVEYSGNRYAITEEEITNKLNKDNDFLIVIVDHHGYEQIKELHGKNNVFYVYFKVTKPICLYRLIKRDGLFKGYKRFKKALKDNEFDREFKYYVDYVVKSYFENIKDLAYKLLKYMEYVIVLNDLDLNAS